MESVPVREAIAIIPAKSVSRRLPGKNLRLFRGIPLFLWSVLYAKEEGFQPVVFTDSEKVRHVAEGFGAIVYPQTKEQFENYDAIVPAIKDLKPKYLLLLQATSPVRKAGAAREMYERALNGEATSFYTCEVKKCVGHLHGKYWPGTAPLTEENTFYQADGNLWLCTADYFLMHGHTFVGDDSKPIANTKPYTLEIDMLEEFRLLETLAREKTDLLVHPIKSIVCIQNQRCIKRNYSDFIEGCDLVVRSGKLDNIDTKRTGTRTDVVFSHTYTSWWTFSEQEKHLPELNKAALIYMDPRFLVPETIKNYFPWPYPPRHYTTSYLALEAMHKAFPEAQLYNLGAHHVRDRKDTFGLNLHNYSDEHVQYDRLVQQGSLIDIDEDSKTENFAYSVDASWNTHSPETIRIARQVWGGHTPWAYLYIWKQRLVLSSTTSPQAATILRWQRGQYVTVIWDKSNKVQKYSKRGKEVYAADGKPILLEDVAAKFVGEVVPSVPLYYDKFFILGREGLANEVGTLVSHGKCMPLLTRGLPEAVEYLCAHKEEMQGFGEHPLFFYIEEGKDVGHWFSFEQAYDNLARLRAEISPEASLIYFARPEKAEFRRPDVVYSDDNFLACTYSVALPHYLYETFEEVFKNVIHKEDAGD